MSDSASMWRLLLEVATSRTTPMEAYDYYKMIIKERDDDFARLQSALAAARLDAERLYLDDPYVEDGCGWDICFYCKENKDTPHKADCAWLLHREL